MAFRIESKHMDGVVVISADTYRDERGFFTESFRKDFFEDLGVPTEFVQDNHSGSTRGVIRGLHFQWEPAMGKLMRVTWGSAFLVAVDIRKGSPSLGKWFGREVSAQEGIQIWAPAGFARGFCTLSAYVEVQYKCTGVYNGHCESGLRWDDRDIGIEWPIKNPRLSDKDRSAQSLRQWLAKPESDYFIYEKNALVTRKAG
jgi:dTDP-4-dehydrorhamnose 3,5-epimerase